MHSSKKLAGNESICTSSQVCNTIDEDPSQTVLAESSIKADMPVTSNVTRKAKKATKKERQRAAKYGLKKLPPIPNVPEKQATFEKDHNSSVAMYSQPSSNTCTTFKATKSAAKANIDVTPS